MKVRNINGTSDNTCKCDSWLAHWEKFSGKKAYMCSAYGCTKTSLVGAHVQKDGLLDRSWYIIPLCQAHNKQAPELIVSDNTQLISANVSETCGKPVGLASFRSLAGR